MKSIKPGGSWIGFLQSGLKISGLRIIDKYQKTLSWHDLSRNSTLPWSIELVDKYSDNWEFKAMDSEDIWNKLFAPLIDDDLISEVLDGERSRTFIDFTSFSQIITKKGKKGPGEWECFKKFTVKSDRILACDPNMKSGSPFLQKVPKGSYPVDLYVIKGRNALAVIWINETRYQEIGKWEKATMINGMSSFDVDYAMASFSDATGRITTRFSSGMGDGTYT